MLPRTLDARSCVALLVVIGIPAYVSPGVAQGRDGIAEPDYVTVAFTGVHMGRLPATNCVSDPSTGALRATALTETTPSNAPEGFASYDVRLVDLSVMHVQPRPLRTRLTT